MQGLRRSGSDDLAASVFAQVEREAPATIRPTGYFQGGEEQDWIDRLRANNTLLLSGISRSGKSVAARWVAAEFQKHGFRIYEAESVEAAERFLLDPAEGGRIAVLDDPFGGAHAVVDAARQLHRLETLLARLSPRRRLILAQGQERLLEITAAFDLAGLSHRGHPWINLGRRSVNFLATLWLDLADRSGVAEPLRSAFADAIRSGAVSLEPGTLDFLANLPAASDGMLTVGQAAQAASVDALSLSDALREEALSPNMLPALALASEADAPAAWEEIAFVGGAGGNGFPSKSDRKGLMLVIGGKPHIPSTMPAYDVPPVLDTAAIDDLDRLERRNIIATDAERRSGFTHPFYRAAAEAYFRNPSPGAADRLLGMHERALFARELSTARAAARSVDWLLNHAGSRPGVSKALFTRAEAGLDSLFPAVRDLCFLFLLRQAARGGNEVQERLPAAVRAVAMVELESLDWIKGEAMFPPDGRIRRDVIRRSLMGPAYESVRDILDALSIAGGSTLAPEATAEAVLYFKRHRDEIAHGHVANLLAYEEGVIRAEAVWIWLGRPRDGDDNILDRIFRRFASTGRAASA